MIWLAWFAWLLLTGFAEAPSEMPVPTETTTQTWVDYCPVCHACTRTTETCRVSEAALIPHCHYEEHPVSCEEMSDAPAP